MNIVWLTWKDLKNPLAGGAEVVNEALAKRLVREGHNVTLLVGGAKGLASYETVDGYNVARVGNRFTAYWKAYRYYKKNFEAGADLVIEEINTIPFFSRFYVNTRSVLLVYQLARKVWFTEIFFPLNIVGYLIEPLYIRVLNRQKVVTISDSSRNDLIRHGFKPRNISVVQPGMDLMPVASLEKYFKYDLPTLLSFGAMRAMKRTLDQVMAFEIAKKSLPRLRLELAGSTEGKYASKVLEYIKKSQYSEDIIVHGRVSEDRKLELMKRAHFIAVTSVKEGWGLIVSEAASQGTPAIVYDVDGLRDAVGLGKYGFIAEPNPPALAEKIIESYRLSESDYGELAERSYVFAKTLTLDNTYKQFKKALNL
jgi:glycosyltransferase involved in cell wall biosynthesis